MTKLDRVVNRDIQTLFVNCYDSTGAYARTVKNVTVTSQNVVLTKTLSNLNSLVKSKGMFLQTSNPNVPQRPYELIDIIQTSEKISSLKALQANLSGEELKNSTTLINQYVKLMMNQIIEISNTLQPSEINVCISQIEGTIEVATNVQGKETLNAINSLMTNQQ